MASDQTFESAKSLLRWAEEDLHNLSIIWKELIAGDFYSSWMKFNAVSVEHEIYFRLDKPFPDSLSKLLNNAACGIRHAFDQMTYAFVSSYGDTLRPDHTYFPWGTSASDVSGRLRALGLEEAHHSPFLHLQPYETNDIDPGGDNVLRKFAKAVNPYKHQVVAGCCARPLFQPLTLVQTNLTDKPVDFVHSVSFIQRVFSRVGDQGVIARIQTTGELKPDFQIAPYIAFADVGVLSHEPALELLQYALMRGYHAIALLEEHLEIMPPAE